MVLWDMVTAGSPGEVPLGWGKAGFFRTGGGMPPLFQAYSAGHELICDTGYCWDGMIRQDGPLHLLQYTLSGCGRLMRGGRDIALVPGDLMILDIPDAHVYRLPPDSTDWEFLYVLLRPGNLETLWPGVRERLGPTCALPRDHKVVKAMEILVGSVLADNPASVWDRSVHIHALLMYLWEATSFREQDAFRIPPGILRVRDALLADFRSLPTVDAMADRACMSRFHFLHTFRRCMGVAPGAFRQRLQVAHGVRRLQESRDDLATIAAECGFAGASYLIKVFRAHTGLTPGQYRSSPVAAEQSPVIWRI